ncbi:DUF4282 domain-containing protein [bacterium]|nr:DUF4282 domain-containing protein [bacterium]
MSHSSDLKSSFDSPAPSMGFGTLVTPKLMRVMYPLGVLAICVVSLISFLGEFGELPGSSFGSKFSIDSGHAFFTICYWIGFLVGSNLSWRVVCETTIVFFRIHDVLARHDARSESRTSDE